MQIYITKNNQQFGPFEEVKVFEMLESGQFTIEDFACHQGASHWQPLKMLFPTLSQNVPKNNVATVSSQEHLNQTIVNWARQNLKEKKEIKLRFSSPFAKILLILFTFFLPIALTIFGIVLLILNGYNALIRNIFMGAGFLFVVFALVLGFAFLIGGFSRRKIVKFIDTEGVETRNKTLYKWNELQYLDYKKFHTARGNLVAAIIQSIMFAGTDRITIELIFANGKALLPPLILNQKEIHNLVSTIPVQHKGKNN